MTPAHDSSPAAHQEKKPANVGSRLALAAGFSYVGAKVGTIGTIMDIDKAVGAGESLTLKQKLVKVFDGTLTKIIKEQVKGKTFMEGTKALSKTFKFSIYTTAIGMAAGAVLGWERGDRVKKPSDLLLHPITSLKLAFGPAPVADAEKSVPAEAPPMARDDSAFSSAHSPKWTQMVTEPKAQAQAVASR